MHIHGRSWAVLDTTFAAPSNTISSALDVDGSLLSLPADSDSGRMSAASLSIRSGEKGPMSVMSDSHLSNRLEWVVTSRFPTLPLADDAEDVCIKVAWGIFCHKTFQKIGLVF